MTPTNLDAHSPDTKERQKIPIAKNIVRDRVSHI